MLFTVAYAANGSVIRNAELTVNLHEVILGNYWHSSVNENMQHGFFIFLDFQSMNCYPTYPQMHTSSLKSLKPLELT